MYPLPVDYCLAEFADAAANKVEIIFCRGVYPVENTLRLANVRVTGECVAASRNPLAESPTGDFRQVYSIPMKRTSMAAICARVALPLGSSRGSVARPLTPLMMPSA